MKGETEKYLLSKYLPLQKKPEPSVVLNYPITA
jgi:hypothetical protein